MALITKEKYAKKCESIFSVAPMMDRADYLVLALVYAASGAVLGALSSRMRAFWLCSVVQIRTATVHER